MTIGKELLVSNLLTTLLWCQAANVLVESSYSFLDSLHQYACPFSTEFCDDLHLGTVLIHETKSATEISGIAIQLLQLKSKYSTSDTYYNRSS